MERYEIHITGIQPMLHHQDSIEWADQMDAWKANAESKKNSKAGDDRSPAWRWLGALYHDGKHVVIPTANIMRCLMEGGAMVPTGQKQKTFKSQTQSGIMPAALHWPLLVKNKSIPVAKILTLINEKDFAKHKQCALDHGFQLFLKRAKIGASKHVRVRPIFDTWEAIGELDVSDEMITQSVLQSIIDQSGRFKGLGDWRPGCKTPGPYGMFIGKVKLLS